MAAKRVALTGGIATGKSACLRAFAALGARTLDADVLAREAVEPGTPGLAAVIARFGRSVLRPDGALDRAALGRLVFADAAARRDLEAIVHPYVYGRTSEVIFTENVKGLPPAVSPTVVDIPLLYETGHEKDFDAVVVAACGPELQLARLIHRDGFSEADARARIAAQMPIEEKVRRANYVVDTSGTVRTTEERVARVWAALISGKSKVERGK